MTAGRHLMEVGGTTAIVKQAIAQISPSTIRKERRPIVPPELLRDGSGSGNEARAAGLSVGLGWNVLGGAGAFVARCTAL